MHQHEAGSDVLDLHELVVLPVRDAGVPLRSRWLACSGEVASEGRSHDRSCGRVSDGEQGQDVGGREEHVGVEVQEPLRG